MVADTKPVDPDSLPFIPPDVKPKETLIKKTPPYPKFRAEFIQLLKDRQYKKAEQALAEAEKDPRFQADRDVLAWDREELQSIAGFWTLARERFQSMPPGTEFNIRRSKVKFVKFSDEGAIHFRASKAGTKLLAEMQPRDLLAALAPQLAKGNAPDQLRTATFLYFDAEGDPKLAESYLEKAGKLGQTFRDRKPGRILHNGRSELDAGRLTEALKILETLQANYPESPAAAVAKTRLAEIYKQIAWKSIGPRVWKSPEPGTYESDKTRQAGSYLVSPQAYADFELRAEWKILEPGGSGGVFFRYAAPGKDDPYGKAFKLQLADDQGFQPDKQTTGALHTYAAPSENLSKPRGEWNTLRLIVRNLKVEVYINGKQVMKTIAQDERVPLSGYIALDGVTGGIAYRKTLLLELPPSVE